MRGDPTNNWAEVTPSDDDNLPKGEPEYLYVGVAGDVHMIVGGEEFTVPLPQGPSLFRPSKVFATNTDADKLFAAYPDKRTT